jgi:hypothetical protein
MADHTGRGQALVGLADYGGVGLDGTVSVGAAYWSQNSRAAHVRVDRPTARRGVHRGDAGAGDQGPAGGNRHPETESIPDGERVEPIRFGRLRRWFIREADLDPDALETARDVAITAYKKTTGQEPVISPKAWLSDPLIHPEDR